MSTLLVHTIGNRDLQFIAGIEAAIREELLRPNPEGGTNLVFQVGTKESFWEQTKAFADHLATASPNTTNYWYPQMSCPMLKSVLQYVAEQTGTIDQLWLLSTGQVPPYGPYEKDTYHAARLVQQYIEYHKEQEEPSPFDAIGEVRILCLTCNLQKDRQGILWQIHQWLQEVHLNFRNIYISNSSGLPKVAEALNLVGVLTNYRYLSCYRSANGQEQLVFEEQLDTQHNIVLDRVERYLKNGAKFL